MTLEPEGSTGINARLSKQLALYSHEQRADILWPAPGARMREASCRAGQSQHRPLLILALLGELGLFYFLCALFQSTQTGLWKKAQFVLLGKTGNAKGMRATIQKTGRLSDTQR